MTGETLRAVLVLALVAVAVLVLMAWSWRRAQRRSTAALPDLPAVPADRGDALTGALEGIYVTSTSAGDWLARVPGRGLGVRSPVEVQVHAAGVTLLRRGATDVFVPAADVVDAHRSSGMAGKYVGGDRLVVLRWRLHAAGTPDDTGPVLDTGLHLRRPEDRDALIEAVTALTGGRLDHEETA